MFAPGEKEKIVSVPIVNDGVLEGEEMFSATLTTDDMHVSLFNSSASVSIIDNDSKHMYILELLLLTGILILASTIFSRNEAIR